MTMATSHCNLNCKNQKGDIT